MLSLRILRSPSACSLLQATLKDEVFADGFWLGVQLRHGIQVTSVSAEGLKSLRVPALPSVLPALRSAAAATASSLSEFLGPLDNHTSWRTIAVAPVPTSMPWPMILGAKASGAGLHLLPGAGILKVMTATAELLALRLSNERLARLNDALIAQAQAVQPWLLSEDDRIVAASPEAWRTIESLWRKEGLDFKSAYARLPFEFSSATGLDLPIQLPGHVSARLNLTDAPFLPSLLKVTFSRSNRPELQVNLLTETERKILSLVLAGMTNRAIAEHTGRSLATVQNHVHAVLQKLGAKDRRELLLRAGHGDTPHPRPVPALQRFEIGPPSILRLKKPVS